MKEELLKLYQSHHDLFRSVVKRFPFDDLAGPFLVSPDERFSRQPVRLLIVGQETHGWPNHLEDLNRQMAAYESFDQGRNAGSSAFWNMIRRLEQLFGIEACASAWTNLSRFDLYGVRTYGKYEKAISAADFLLDAEIRILKPDICIFFTGPYFDNRLKNVFSGVEFTGIPGWNSKQFCALRHPGLPPLSFRAYHPRSLRLKSLEKSFIDHLSALAKDRHSIHSERTSHELDLSTPALHSHR